MGAGIGYVVGNEVDKKEAERYRDAQQHGPSAYETLKPLSGTRWILTSLVPKDRVPPFASKVVEFRPDARLITTTTFKDGKVVVADEHYRIVDNTLIVNKPNYLVNAHYFLNHDKLIVSGEDFSAVLSRSK